MIFIKTRRYEIMKNTHRKKIMVLAGTRPEAIKLALVIHKLKEKEDVFETIVCATGQHMEMLSQAFHDFDIVPDENLEVMQPGQTLAGVTSRLFTGIDNMLESQKPDWLLVQGDTTTVMVGALCAYYRRIKVGHIEAGLRSQNIWAPFPEEVNRRIAGIVTTTHFAPTQKARQNLLDEGVDNTNIIVTGNSVIDALLYTVKKVRSEIPDIPSEIKEALNDADAIAIMGGSSVGTKDMTAKVINSFGKPGVLFHGVSIKPGKPMIGGVINGKPIFGLPGHPAAVITCFDLFIKPILKMLSGEIEKLHHRLKKTVRAKVAKNISSGTGREDRVRVQLEEKNNELWATPILGKSGLITTLVKADGTVVVPLRKAGIEQGTEVEVELF